MKGFTFFVTGCWRCPYREGHEDGDYCAAHDGYAESRRQVVRDNSDGITESCPEHDECKESE